MDSIKRTVAGSIQTLQIFDQKSLPRLPELPTPSNCLFGSRSANSFNSKVSSDLALDTSTDALNFLDILDEPKAIRKLPRIPSLDDALCVVGDEECNLLKQVSAASIPFGTARKVSDCVGFEIASFRYSKTGEEPKAIRNIPKITT